MAAVSLLSLVLLPRAPWQPCHHVCGDDLPLIAFTPWSEDSPGDLALVLGEGGQKQAEKLPIDFLFFYCFFFPLFSQGGLEKAADTVGNFSL